MFHFYLVVSYQFVGVNHNNYYTLNKHDLSTQGMLHSYFDLKKAVTQQFLLLQKLHQFHN